MKTLRDHRGERIRGLVPYDLLPQEVRLTLPIPGERDKRARTWWQFNYWLTVAVTILTLCVLMLLSRAFALPIWLIGGAAGLVGFRLLAGRIHRAWLASIAEQVINACARESLCASCGYSLAGLARQSDGCVICPECGAAWRAALAQGLAPQNVPRGSSS